MTTTYNMHQVALVALLPTSGAMSTADLAECLMAPADRVHAEMAALVQDGVATYDAQRDEYALGPEA